MSTSLVTDRKSEPAYYGWVIVAIAALAMVATLPGRTHGLGMITERMLTDPVLGIDRVQFSEINFWGTLIGGLFCLPCGWLIDRLGLRVTLTATVLALAVVVLWMTRLHGNQELAVAILLTRGFGQSALSVISITMVGKWFAQRTSLAMAVYSLLLSLGFAYAAQIAKPWADADWRVVWGAMGYSLLAFVPICLSLCRDPKNASPLTASAERCCGRSESESAHHWTVSEALRTQAFWVFALATSLIGLISSGLSLFNESVLAKQGFSKETFYNLITWTGTIGLLTKLPIGWIGERWSLNRLLSVGLILQAICMVSLPFIRSITGISVYGAGMGVSGTITTVLFFTIWSRAFGRRHLGQIQAIAQLLTVVASAAGPVVFAHCLQRYGNYSPAFMTLAGVSGGFAIWSWFVPFPTRAPSSAASAVLRTYSPTEINASSAR